MILLQSNAKLKLVRSLAVCEESCGPFSNDGPPESVPVSLTSYTNQLSNSALSLTCKSPVSSELTTLKRD